MTCAEFEDLILDQIDGRLSPSKMALTEKHIATCERCHAFITAAIEMDRSMTHLARSVRSPARFTSGVLQSRKAAEPRFTRFAHPGAIWDLAGLGGVAAAGAFCVWHLIPNVLVGGGWLAATVILCGGAYIALADPEAP